MTVDHEGLLTALSRLKLTAVRDQLDSLLDEAARRELSLREALAFLIEITTSPLRHKEKAGAELMPMAPYCCVPKLNGIQNECRPAHTAIADRGIARSSRLTHGLVPASPAAMRIRGGII